MSLMKIVPDLAFGSEDQAPQLAPINSTAQRLARRLKSRWGADAAAPCHASRAVGSRCAAAQTSVSRSECGGEQMPSRRRAAPYSTLVAGRPFMVAMFLGLGLVACSRSQPVEQLLAAHQERMTYPELSIRYPQDGTVFPPDLRLPCTFSWEEQTNRADRWVVLVEFPDGTARVASVCPKPSWTPTREQWEQIKQRSRAEAATVTVLGFQQATPSTIRSRGRLRIGTSPDAVGAPIFYREVNLPFKEAVKDSTHIRWRFGSIASPEPPRIVLEHLPVCGNCHSFSRDGKVLGMDVDYANNKGSYVITRLAKDMPLATSDIMTWDGYRPEDKQQTFGLLSQVSPDGQAVISTVKDKSVFVATPNLAFSQLFFPIKGILVVYRRASGTFQSLPGADDPQYVQSNPAWSPDGKYIVFARTKAYELRSRDAIGRLLLSEADCAEFLHEGKPFQFDLYRVPYNDGRGGEAEPLRGASANGRSNFFPKYSPDGKWIVFCQASNYMLLQPDSELFVIPAAGGEARRLRANTARMNSWHSWSPNSRWLVFSSKASSPYTQLFLTHIDPQGESTPPVLLANFTAPDRAANIPEFVNTEPEAIVRIHEQFLDDNSHARAAYTLETTGDIEKAIAEYEQALKLNPRNPHAHQRLGFLLFHAKRRYQDGLAHTTEALRLDPSDGCAHYDLAMALEFQGHLAAAIPHLSEAARLLPSGFDRRYNPEEIRCALAEALLRTDKPAEAAKVLAEALQAVPESARARYLFALALAAQGNLSEALQQYELARAKRPDLDTMAELHLCLSVDYARSGQMPEALAAGRKALKLAQAKGNAELIGMINDQLQQYNQPAGQN